MLHVSVRFDDTLLTQFKRCGIWWLQKGSILHNHFIVIAPLSGSIVMIFYAWLLRSTGLHDDLQFLLEEDLSHINLCSLHCEMRNCEQLLGSLGLFAHRVGSLDELNQALSERGPESCRGFPRVTVKQRPGQQTAIERKNIKVASFSGLIIFALIVGLLVSGPKWWLYLPFPYMYLSHTEVQ